MYWKDVAVFCLYIILYNNEYTGNNNNSNNAADDADDYENDDYTGKIKLITKIHLNTWIPTYIIE